MSKHVKEALCLILWLGISAGAVACKCSTELSMEMVSSSSDIIHIKVTSLHLLAHDGDGTTREGVEVGYEIIERFWGPQRKPEL